MKAQHVEDLFGGVVIPSKPVRSVSRAPRAEVLVIDADAVEPDAKVRRWRRMLAELPDMFRSAARCYGDVQLFWAFSRASGDAWGSFWIGPIDELPNGFGLVIDESIDSIPYDDLVPLYRDKLRRLPMWGRVA